MKMKIKKRKEKTPQTTLIYTEKEKK